MNLPAIAGLIRSFPLENFYLCSKIISEVNAILPEEHHINSKMTGVELLSYYQSLPYILQEEIYALRITSRIEEKALYGEVKMAIDNLTLKKLYNNNMVSTVMLDVSIILTVIFTGTTLLYRQNTIKNGDHIDANIISTIVHIVEYLVGSII